MAETNPTEAPNPGSPDGAAPNPDEATFGDALDYGAGDVPQAPQQSDKEVFGDSLDYSKTPSTEVEKAVAVPQSLLGTAVETSGLIAGAKIGIAVTAPIPIPFARVAGAVVGGGIGWWAGHEARAGLSDLDIPGTDMPVTRPNIEAFPEDQRSGAIVGEVFGGGLPLTAITVRVAKQGFRFTESFIGNFLNRILKNASERTRSFVGAEMAGLTGASVGGVIAEQIDPGDKLSRFGGEVVGGILNPTRILFGFADKISATFKKGLQAVPGNIGAAARERAVANILGDMVEESGGDPILLAKLLEANGLHGIGHQTSAIKTGHPVLAEFQAQLVKINGRFSHEAGQLMEANLNNLDDMIRAMRSSGQPDALQTIANLQGTKFNMMIQSRLNAAEREVMDSVGDISKLGPEARTALSKRAVEIVTEVRKFARQAEHELWEAIPQGIRVRGDDVVEEAGIILKELAPTGEKLPKQLQFFVDKINQAGSDGTVSLGDIIAFRKRALQLAADAAAGSGRSSASEASMYGRMAEAVLDSLDSTFGAVGSPQQGLNRALGLSADAYTAARVYSREFNDVFTRTFAGQMLRKNARGTSLVPAEVALPKALANGGDEGAMRLRELTDATDFMRTKGLGEAVDVNRMVDDMQKAQENMVRILATKYIDPLTKRVSPKSMKQFMDDSPELMQRFPELKKNLERAIKSEVEFQNIAATGSLPGRAPLDATRIGRQQAAFAKIGKFDNSVAAVKAAIRDKNPERGFKRLVELANKGGYHEKEGLRSSVFDHILDEASKSGALNYKQIRAGFFEPLQKGGKESLMDILQKSKVMDSSDIKRLTQLLDEGDKIGRVAAATGRVDEGRLIQEVDVLTDLLTRVGGAVAASRTAKYFGFGGQGPSLIIASSGSRAAQRALDRVPQTAMRDIFIEAATKPKFMAMLLRKPRTPDEAVDFNRQLHAYLVQALFIPMRGSEEDEELPLPSGS